MWKTYPIGENPEGWIELSENGWGAVAAWFAGPENVMRQPFGERTDLKRFICELADGTTKSWTEPVTPADIQMMEDDIDAYLQDVKLPPRPRGFRWFLRLPATIADEHDFWRRLNTATAEMPYDSKRNMERVTVKVGDTIASLYASPAVASKRT